jgi:hypothetical protein
MKHAGPDALDALDELLTRIRSHPELREKSRGCFYRKSQGFLHFHEDPDGFFADLKVGGEFERFRVSSRAERAAFLRELAAELKR